MKPEVLEEQLRAMKETLLRYMEQEVRFTGKIVFTVNCHNGGVGNTEAYVQKKIG